MILRLRSMLNTINLHYCDRRVLVVCHQVVVLCFRYILEELDEAANPQASTSRPRSSTAASAPTTSIQIRRRLRARAGLWNYGAPLEAEGAPKTSAPGRDGGNAVKHGKPLDRTALKRPSAPAGRRRRQGDQGPNPDPRRQPPGTRRGACSTATAAMRAGAGKLQHRDASKASRTPLGIAMPEAMVVGLAEDA